MDFEAIKKILSKVTPVSSTVNFLLNRANLSNSTLKQKYSSVLRIGGLFGCVFMLLGFYSLQRFENDIDIETEGQIIIENIEIPETQQFETPPPPARPSIPVESEDDDLADDLTIEETDLDNFDAWDAPPPPPSGPQVKFIPYDKGNADEAFMSAACIGCGACVAACKNSSAMLFTSAKVSHLALLPQGESEQSDRVNKMVATMDAEGFGACTNTGACSAECPKEISQTNIARLNREFVKAQLGSFIKKK